LHNAPSPINIGTIRYTSTARMHRGINPLVEVFIQPTDFLARRTAVLGMTRTGKSNTVKTTVSAVAVAAMRDNIRIGQLIFDVNGEYANANHQDDGSSIAEVFPTQTIRYRALETTGFEDIRPNFYIECAQALNLIQALFKNDNSPFSGQDLDAFMSTSLDEPDPTDRSCRTHYGGKDTKQYFNAYYLVRGYPVPAGFTIEVPIAAALLNSSYKVGTGTAACRKH
jgi:hypothetical protein